MFGTRISENSRQLGTSHNVAKKVDVKLKTGAVLQRATLGDIRNKPNLHSTVSENQKILLHKKVVQTTSLKPTSELTEKENGKENILPVKLHHKAKAEESMEVDETEEIKVEELSLAFSSQLLNVEDIDSEDSDNPQLVSAYVNDIYKYMWELEETNKVTPNYLEGQKLTHRMRAILIDWLIQVHLRFTLLQETLYLTVAIIDRYLMTVRTTPKEKLQLVGVTAMFIASKYEEMYIPEVADFAYITDKTFSKEDICKMEVQMLKSLNYYISFPLPLHFLRRDSKAGHVDADHHTLAKFLMELTLPEYEFTHYKSSVTAAASLYLSMKILNIKLKWSTTLSHYSNYSETEILPVVYKLSALVMKSYTSRQQAVRTKYKSQKLMKISDLKDLRPPFCPILKKYAAKVHR